MAESTDRQITNEEISHSPNLNGSRGLAASPIQIPAIPNAGVPISPVSSVKLSLNEGTPSGSTSIRRVVVIGAGWVGRQIVGQCASHGMLVWWVDKSEAALQSGVDWLASASTRDVIGSAWPNPFYDAQRPEVKPTDAQSAVGLAGNLAGDDLSAERNAPMGGAVMTCLSIAETPTDIDLVIETVSEQISIKRQVFKEATRHYAASTILTSNSSYFTPSMLKRFVDQPERFAHLHFHVPVWRTKLVDIAAGPETDPAVLAKLQTFAECIGQHALVQTVENPGYVFNWMLKALLQSALQLKVKGVASAEEIDFAWKQVTNMELGPFGIMDQIGIDLIHQTMSAGRFVDGDDVWQPLIDELQPLIDQNHLGAKTGQGFYKHG